MCTCENNKEKDDNSSNNSVKTNCQGNICNENKINLLYELLKAETDLQQKRVWFFGILITAILTGWYLVNESKNNDGDYNQKLKIILPFLATIIALIQCFLNRGSKYWFNYLHSQISKNIKGDNDIYSDNVKFPNCVKHLKGTGFFWKKRKVKIPMLFIFFADFVFINCLMLFIYELCKNMNSIFTKKADIQLIIFFVINILIVLIAFVFRPNKWCKKCNFNSKNNSTKNCTCYDVNKTKDGNQCECKSSCECKFWDIFE